MSNKRTHGWKKLTILVLVVSFILALTGCIQYEANATIHSDGTIDFHILYATIDLSAMSDDTDSSDMNLDSGAAIDATIEKLEEYGWKADKYQKKVNDVDYIGFTCSKNGIKLDELDAELQKMKELDMGFGGFSLTKNGDTYILNWDMSSNTSDMESQGVDASSIAQYGGYMKFTLDLPDGAISHNATKASSDGTSLEWDLLSITEPAHVEFKLDSSDSKKGGKKDKDDEDDDDDDEDDDEDSGKKSKDKKSKDKKSKKSSDSSGLPAWALGLIIGGSVLVVAAVVVIIIVLVKKGKNKDQTPAA